jgi:NAD(P)-dependent dehydrogenase (short-subunit alcohol dehydrogenase family)
MVGGISGSGAVITGGGAGIGRALARALAGAGARVVVNDLDPEAAAAVAEQVGGYPLPGDAATEEGVRDLIAAARKLLGEIDIYCSNAGIAAGTGPDTPEEIWQRAWEVNVLAHVRASRELLPAVSSSPRRRRGCSPCSAPRRTR